MFKVNDGDLLSVIVVMTIPAGSRSDVGEPGDQAPLVLLITGQPGSSMIWTRLRPILRSYGLRVVSIERPHSHRSGSEPGQLQHAAALIRFLEDQHSPIIVVGHGLGAGTALALSVLARHRVGSLVLVAPVAGASALTRIDGMLATLRIALLLRQKAVWRILTAAYLQLVADARQLDRHLPGIRVPIVIVAGARDRIVRPRTITAISRKLSDFDVITTDTGHLIPVDDPGAVATAVLRALAAQFRHSLRGVHPSLDR